jgi:hypothetical protein
LTVAGEGYPTRCVEDPLHNAYVAALVEAIATRSDDDARRLTAVLGQRCWPGGASDRSERSALDWVRRWGPRRVAPALARCSCAQGRCAVCN